MKRLITCFFAVILTFASYGFNCKVDAIDGSNVTRLWGKDRYETAISISENGWQSSEYAVIARGDDFPDALCAAPLAMKYNAPILLTEPDKLSEGVLAELKRLGTRHIIIVGGPGAVSQGVENLLRGQGMDIERLGGIDRYATSVEIAKKVGNNGSVILATGDNFPDSLSISPIAALLGMPILLSSKSSLPNSVSQYIEDNVQVKTTYVIGGKGVISDSVLDFLCGPERIGGNNRFETNVAVMKRFEGSFDFKKIFVSVADGPSGNEFADALSGSVLAARSSSPMVLVYGALTPATDIYLRDRVSKDSMITLLGGESVVPSSIVSNIMGEGNKPVSVNIQNPPQVIRSWQTKSVNIVTDPADASIRVSSSNTGVAVVSASGKIVSVTGVSPGIAVITVTAEKGGYPVGSSTFLVTSPIYNSRQDKYYDTIQDAVNSAGSGDTIRISSGTYYEHLNIKSNNLKLIGEDRDSTIIDATQNGVITRAGVKIDGFSGIEIRNLTIRNAGVNVTGEASREPYGILAVNSDQDILSNLSLKSNGSYEMYFLDDCDNNTVENCTIDGEGLGRDGYRSLDGIFFCGKEAANGSGGLVNSGNRVFGNIICNVVNGISLTASNSAWIKGNTIHALDSSYWIGYSSAGIILSNSSMNLIEDNTMDSSQYGIRLSILSGMSPYSYAGVPASNIIRDNSISAIQTGIRLVGVNNTLQGNTLSGNSNCGIWIDDSTWSSEIIQNIFDKNSIDILCGNGMNEVHYNKFSGKTYTVKNTSDTELDAALNWWGSPTSPGGSVYGKVNYNPWALDDSLTKFSS